MTLTYSKYYHQWGRKSFLRKKKVFFGGKLFLFLPNKSFLHFSSFSLCRVAFDDYCIVWYQVWRPIIRLYMLPPWSLDLFFLVLFQYHIEHTVLQPFRRFVLIVDIAISVLPGTNFHLSQVQHLRVKCLAQRHNIETIKCPKINMQFVNYLILFAWAKASVFYHS